ncbi:3-ketodihydrosphingosine reductase-like [Agrilus planipennis]|uniref:3-dehydrosphinganine reductase n=1 Tax=Agrilus planipennis TaxID=224129 RepID=A0A1W4WZP0_AGRPL|nr:3-ketodihydrosphingosine reductase-like [Agrilus planipennis]
MIVLVSLILLFGGVGLLSLFLFKKCSINNINSIKSKYVVVTGGSSGIGKSLAKLCVQLGADVTIIARNEEKLENALKELLQYKSGEFQQITAVSCDTSNYPLIKSELEKLEANTGPIYMLINCVGAAICGKLEDMSIEDIESQISMNFFGIVYPIKAIISKLKQRKEGIIVLTASQAALLGIFGLSIYSGSKFALRGFAEALDMEVRPYNISITVALPPDTDTPGFEKENIGKPKETALICETAGLYDPDVVARAILKDALKRKFFSFLGFESYLMATLCIGMAPFSSFLEVIIQSLLIGPIRLISAFYLTKFHCIVKRLAE